VKRKLDATFYQQKDVVALAKSVLGKRICTRIDGIYSSGIITETEAYNGVIDKASHAYGGRMTERTKIMYENGGIAYVYLCYGIHHLFNLITNQEGIPEAILIRAMEAEEGTAQMLKRRKKIRVDKTLCGGPGTVSQALGITTKLNGVSLTGNQIWLEETDLKILPKEISVGPRIGVDYAGADAKLPYRFILNRNGK
jgi:DNA-3-methyladenine glycosylase